MGREEKMAIFVGASVQSSYAPLIILNVAYLNKSSASIKHPTKKKCAGVLNCVY